jgi:hypothetical protein
MHGTGVNNGTKDIINDGMRTKAHGKEMIAYESPGTTRPETTAVKEKTHASC